MDLQLADKLAFVSGSTAGIGFAIAQTLAQEGARIITNGRTQADADAAARAIAAATGAQVQGFGGDLATAKAAQRAGVQFKDVDILVNSLGIYETQPFVEISDATWLRFFETNVMSGIRLTREFLPGMQRRNWGRVIFISSESAVQIPPEMIHYGTTKTAQLAVARGLAESLAGTGITVNSVLPGPTRSRGVEGFVQKMARDQGTTFEALETEFFTRARPSSLLRRFAAPQEVASLVAYLASPLASATTGAAVRAEGGIVRSIL